VEYPARGQFFAHKFVRLIHKTALAAEIGRDALALLVVVAHTEDAMRYRGAAKFWNSQLIETLGFSKWDQFDKARRRAVESGWLNYVCHGRKQAGEYHVLVPDGYSMVDDNPIEHCTLLSPESEYDRGYKQGYKQGMIEGITRVQTGGQLGDEQGDLSIPIPYPNPLPEIEDNNNAAIAAPPANNGNQVVDEFNAAFLLKCRLTAKRKSALALRLREDYWRENWRAALDRGSRSDFLCGRNDRGWMIDLEFFLKPDTVTKIMEGKYDNRETTVRATGNSAAAREQRTATAFDAMRNAAAANGYGGIENHSSSTGAIVFQ
jgi:hypothetical protein